MLRHTATPRTITQLFSAGTSYEEQGGQQEAAGKGTRSGAEAS